MSSSQSVSRISTVRSRRTEEKETRRDDKYNIIKL